MSKSSWFTSAFLLCTMLLAGCGQKLEGIYKDDLGVQEYEFTSDGTVYISTIGMTSEGTYELEDNKVKITKGPNDVVIYSMNKDGSIKGPLGLELRPQPSK